MQYRVYRTNINFVHHIEYRSELVDKACVDDHKHPNAELVFEIATKEWVDFKILKELCNLSIHAMFLSDDHSVKEGDTTYNHIGTIDSETFVRELKKRVRIELVGKGFTKIKVNIRMWETSKYGLLDIDEEETLPNAGH